MMPPIPVTGMNPLHSFALAIMWREGPYKPGVRSYRNNNPGNLRAPGWHGPHDPDGFDIYPNFIVGFNALVNELWYKFTGHNSHGIGQSSTLLQLMDVYAPAEDHNDPKSYANFVAEWLTASLGKAITFATLLSEIWAPVSP